MYLLNFKENILIKQLLNKPFRIIVIMLIAASNLLE